MWNHRSVILASFAKSQSLHGDFGPCEYVIVQDIFTDFLHITKLKIKSIYTFLQRGILT